MTVTTASASADASAGFARDGAAAAIASARRAALAGRYAADTLTVEWRAFEQLEAVADPWRDLAAGALEPNVFYEPAFALAAAPVFGRGVGALLVWSATTPARLLGFFPARIERRRYGMKLPVLVGWTHPYAPLGVPLLDREAAEPALAALFAHLAADPALPGLLLLPHLRADGPFAGALDTLARRAQMPAVDFNRRRRAMLARPAAQVSSALPARYLDDALGARRLKELRRLGRRLAERGAVLFTSATAPAAVAAALEDFLALEARGWKGRAGSAAAVNEDLCRFVRDAVAALAAEGKVSIERLLLDGSAIAAAIVLRSGRAAWFWKIAYDEAFARFSPGVLLTAALTEELVEDERTAETDSCADENHPMIDHIWRERLTLCERLIAIRPQAPFARARRLEGLRSAAIAGAKRARGYLKR